MPELGMYMRGKIPSVKAGKFTICRQDEKGVWIETDEGEGGAFPDELFEKAIEEFFNKYF